VSQYYWPFLTFFLYFESLQWVSTIDHFWLFFCILRVYSESVLLTISDFFSVFWEFTVSQYYWPFLTLFLYFESLQWVSTIDHFWLFFCILRVYSESVLLTISDFFSVFWEFTVTQYYWPFLTFFLYFESWQWVSTIDHFWLFSCTICYKSARKTVSLVCISLITYCKTLGFHLN
jgi:hypothetical protein